MDNKTEEIIMQMLKTNMGYQEGNDVGIIRQDWHDGLPDETKPAFEESRKVCDAMARTFSKNKVDVIVFPYKPEEANHGVDASPSMYDTMMGGPVPEIVFAPTPFSLTHTKFRKYLCDEGARVATMPTFTMKMFEQNGPMDTNYEVIARAVQEEAIKLRECRQVYVTAPDTEMQVKVNPELVLEDTGLFHEAGNFGNLPAGEAFAVPTWAEGHFTVQSGWGGKAPLEHRLTFRVENGLIVSVEGSTKAANKFVEEVIKPDVFGGEGYNILAELGIGKNTNVTSDYVMKNGWSPLTAEKIIGTVHFANGNSKFMGGDNNVPVHLDWVVDKAKIEYRT